MEQVFNLGSVIHVPAWLLYQSCVSKWLKYTQQVILLNGAPDSQHKRQRDRFHILQAKDKAANFHCMGVRLYLTPNFKETLVFMCTCEGSVSRDHLGNLNKGTFMTINTGLYEGTTGQATHQGPSSALSPHGGWKQTSVPGR